MNEFPKLEHENNSREFSESERIINSFYDELQIIDPNDTVVEEYSQYIRSILQEFTKTNLRVKILFSDSDELIACTVPSGDLVEALGFSPIVLSKGMLSKINTIESLLLVLTHELTHIEVFDNNNSRRNSKTEEYLADLNYIEKLYTSGYDINKVYEFAEKIFSDKKEDEEEDEDDLYSATWGNSKRPRKVAVGDKLIQVTLDVHGENGNRLQLIKTSIAAVKEKYGQKSFYEKEIPELEQQTLPDFKDFSNSLSHQLEEIPTFKEKTEVLLQQIPFALAGSPKRLINFLEILESVCKNIPEEEVKDFKNTYFTIVDTFLDTYDLHAKESYFSGADDIKSSLAAVGNSFAEKLLPEAESYSLAQTMSCLDIFSWSEPNKEISYPKKVLLATEISTEEELESLLRLFPVFCKKNYSMFNSTLKKLIEKTFIDVIKKSSTLDEVIEMCSKYAEVLNESNTIDEVSVVEVLRLCNQKFSDNNRLQEVFSSIPLFVIEARTEEENNSINGLIKKLESHYNDAESSAVIEDQIDRVLLAITNQSNSEQECLETLRKLIVISAKNSIKYTKLNNKIIPKLYEFVMNRNKSILTTTERFNFVFEGGSLAALVPDDVLVRDVRKEFAFPNSDSLEDKEAEFLILSEISPDAAIVVSFYEIEKILHNNYLTTDVLEAISVIEKIEKHYENAIEKKKAIAKEKNENFSKIERRLFEARMSNGALTSTGKILNYFYRRLAKEAAWNTTIENKVKLYTFAQENELFKDGKHKEDQQRNIIFEIQNLDISERGRYLQQFLSNDYISSVEVRRLYLDSFIENILYETQKQENLSTEKIIEMTKDINNYYHLEVLTSVANQLLLQKEESYQLRDFLAKSFLKKDSDDFQFIGLGIKGVEVMFEIIAANNSCLSVLDFLTKELDEKAIDEAHKVLLKNSDSIFDNLSTDPRVMIITTEKDFEESTSQEYTIAAKKQRIRSEKYFLEKFHENFWAMPFEFRTVVVDTLLTKSSTKSKPSWDIGYKVLCEKYLKNDTPYSKEATEILSAYLDGCEKFKKSIFISAILSAGQVVSSQEEIDIGSLLARFLELMGPAEIKLGQILHSLPEMPPEIADKLAHLKYAARLIPRWEIFERLEEVVPSDIMKDISEVGPLSGASINMATPITYNGQQKIIIFERPHVEPRIVQGYESIEYALDHAKIPNLTDFTETVTTAKSLASDEIDQETNVDKLKQAHEIYSGITIGINEKEYAIQTPGVAVYGDGYRIIDYFPGKLFAKKDSDFGEKEKKESAVAVVTTELLLTLSGKQTDRDRHGGNFTVNTETNTIGLFDFGGLDIKEPSFAEKIVLSELFGSLIRSQLEGIDNQSLSIREIISGALKKYPAEREYIVTLGQRIMALSEYTPYIRDSWFDILTAIVQTEKVDIDILENLRSKGIDLSALKTGESKISLSFKEPNEWIPPIVASNEITIEPDTLLNKLK